ncbi:Adenylate kinase isoenzyme 6 [Hondaea fermentalgiana]|uniref:Adenylate kinase isoenzyme 6 homolog n=1 Tax=Hondaea fermentalgiana TaxID=2315210 RepID=A0A2R5GAL6_9STRA|nr:Adenylate kinase isoenzyme 6 [Hondaea fermentalgiana]|eukprot:GBG28052.1 Adenylate kinase isoenzyme 6 [Hondaea fermentalgiana]
MSAAEGRALPNVLVTGTPGTGKSAHCAAVAEALAEMEHVDVNALARSQGLFAGKDEERDVDVLDDDKVCDALEEVLKPGGKLVDTHSMVDYFPERWFDLVVILRTDNTLLFDRLTKRGYSPSKVQENVQAEIMQVLEEEAKDSYAKEIVQVLKSDNVEDLESNVERIVAWAKAWIKDNEEDGSADDVAESS